MNREHLSEPATQTPLALELEGVSYGVRISRLFGSRYKQILHDVSLRLDSGESLGIMGRSGSGKSTLARVCAGLTHRSDRLMGKLKVCGQEVRLNTLAEQRAFYAKVQILLQDSLSSLNPRGSVFDNLCEGLIYLKGVRHRHAQLERIMPLINQLGLGEAALGKSVGMLSGGEAQRVCLARALLLEPRLLILDESLSGLDSELCAEVVEFLQGWQERSGASVMLITHDERLALRFCHKVHVLEQGKLTQ